ncbi:MAG: ABC transporter substrate-binding protein [Methylococcales bacterium]
MRKTGHVFSSLQPRREASRGFPERNRIFVLASRFGSLRIGCGRSGCPGISVGLLALAVILLGGCNESGWNNPYPESDAARQVLYTSFSERPKHLDPAVSYSANEYGLIGQIYEPVLQYHYLLRPYTLVPSTATAVPEVIYRDRDGRTLPDDSDENRIAFSEYVITIQSGIGYQPHPAFAKNDRGEFLYHDLSPTRLDGIRTIADFEKSDSRELIAEDYVYQIKRLVDPRSHSPIAEFMKAYIVGLSELSSELEAAQKNGRGLDLRRCSLRGVESLDRSRFRITIRGKYPQFRYWLAMPFFAPMPWEAVEFYNQPGLGERNITLDWYPLGTGPFMLIENNPNRRMVLVKNPNFHGEVYPRESEESDSTDGLLADAGKTLPFIDRVVFTLEREDIPYWNKFLQGYYDASGIASDSFDQAIKFTGAGEVELTEDLKSKGIELKTNVTTSIFYVGFNMLDSVVGGETERARKLRQAVAIAVDYEEYISIFMNGRGIAAQGMLPPGIFGYQEGKQGINPYVYDWADRAPRRKSLDEAEILMGEAGYAEGLDPVSGESLILYFDTVATGPDDKARLSWFRKQFAKLGIHLVIRATDYNRFQQKMRTGNAQIFMWGWNADYPDPENFFFLLYGPNAKVEAGGENAGNYRNPRFDKRFEAMRNMENGEERFRLIQELQEIARQDAPWLFGVHPKNFSLYHGWYKNLKPNLMANNNLKYLRIDTEQRESKRKEWNRPKIWPVFILVLAVLVLIFPAWLFYRRKRYATAF